MSCGHVDVRDAARVHIKALFDDRFDKGRWLPMEGVTDKQKIFDIIHKYRPKEGADLFVGNPGTFNAEGFTKVDDSKTRELLDFEYISLEKSILDEFDALMLLKKQEEEETAK